MHAKAYLGDGVYVEWGGYGVVLTTDNGKRVTNRIVLEPAVLRGLIAFVRNGEPETTKREHGE